MLEIDKQHRLIKEAWNKMSEDHFGSDGGVHDNDPYHNEPNMISDVDLSTVKSGEVQDDNGLIKYVISVNGNEVYSTYLPTNRDNVKKHLVISAFHLAMAQWEMEIGNDEKAVTIK